MGEYYKIVNLTKQQYFSASVFNEGVKRYSILQGVHAYALGKLLTVGLEEENPKWQKGNSIGVWAGSWTGNSIAVVGDQTPATYSNFLNVEASNPENSPTILNDIIELEFENVSGILICWLINDKVFSEWLFKELRRDKRYIGDIGYIAYKFRHLSDDLIIFLEEHFTKGWERNSRKIWEDKNTVFIAPNV